MRIRHFILMGVFLGAAAFFPINAFAEKNSSAGQPVPQNSQVHEVHTQVIRKPDTPEASNKAIPVNPENINRKPEQAGQKPVQKPDSRPVQSVKPDQKSPDKTGRNNNKLIPSIKKKIKAGKPPETAVMEKGQAPIQAKPKVMKAKIKKASKMLPPSQRRYQTDGNSHNLDGKAKPDTFTENKKLSISKKKRSSLNVSEERLIEDKQKTPSGNRKNPRVIEIMNIPPQRTQTPGGQSNEQISAGAGTLSYIAGLFDCNEYFSRKHGRIYNTRQADYLHQWINAPPLPPPKAAPFFLTFIA
ncbi:hypothetical protein J7E38_08090 [Bacillus sp. ISL-35]|uniref:hypothetical protein n=1 Tax=Bacillus sp. ISL-35 TaxID=2819122 RepID=UPI001BEAF99A|nr:hypothetical protein [Bacillus sp. ISL-35]MBT2678959.1 hypothetical protein [Bacillus sp. ISL-35]MBT2703955.1 hypothetical protein [Chryseobacterium sp. ISL-80]